MRGEGVKSKFLPSCFSDDHLSPQGAELSPEIPVLKGDLKVLVHPLARGPSEHSLVVTVAREGWVAAKLLTLTD